MIPFVQMLNRLPERIQVLLILLIAPILLASTWLNDRVLFSEPECGSICDNPIPTLSPLVRQGEIQEMLQELIAEDSLIDQTQGAN